MLPPFTLIISCVLMAFAVIDIGLSAANRNGDAKCVNGTVITYVTPPKAIAGFAITGSIFGLALAILGVLYSTCFNFLRDHPWFLKGHALFSMFVLFLFSGAIGAWAATREIYDLPDSCVDTVSLFKAELAFELAAVSYEMSETEDEHGNRRPAVSGYETVPGTIGTPEVFTSPRSTPQQ